MKILLADDDSDMLDVTAYALRREGFNIIVATNGAQALRRWQSDDPDLVLLDVSMPRGNGFEVCRKIRQTSMTPIIMLTGADDEEHVVKGFLHGADDYVTKPFSAKQLALRIRAVMRRCSSTPAQEISQELRVGDFLLDIESCQAHRGTETVQLTALEFRILHALAMNEGHVVSFRRLVERAWGYDGGDASMLKTHVSHIRKKLSLQPGSPGHIGVVHGVGYYLLRSPQGAAVAS